MPAQKRKDDDLVPKDKPPSAKRQKGSQQLPSDLPPPNILPEWNPLLVENDLERDKSCLPHRINRSSPIEIFKLFFTDKWLDVIVKYPNSRETQASRQSLYGARDHFQAEC